MGSYLNGHFPKAFLSSVCHILSLSLIPCQNRLGPCYRPSLKGETPVIELWTCTPHCGWLGVRNAEEDWAHRGGKVERRSGVHRYTRISDFSRLEQLSQSLVQGWHPYLMSVCLHLKFKSNLQISEMPHGILCNNTISSLFTSCMDYALLPGT